MRRYAVFALAAFTAILLSWELAYSLPLGGVGPDLLVIVVAAFAAGEQPRGGALGGYAAGFVRDLLLTAPVGLGALAYAVTGYVVALVGPMRGVWPFVGVVAGASFLSQTIHGLGTIVLGQSVDPAALPRVVVATTVYDAILAPLLFPLLRRLVVVEGAGAGD